MDFVAALKGGNDDIVSFFQNRLGSMEKSRDAHFKSLVESMEQKFKSLLSDGDSDEPEFLVPELPKPKKAAKEKRKSRGAYIVKDKSINSKTSTKPSQEAQHECGPLGAEVSSDSEPTAEIVRKSSRIASKGKSKIDQNAASSTDLTSSTNAMSFTTASDGSSEPVSPSLPPAKIRCVENVNFEKPNMPRQKLDMSLFSMGIKDEQPLGSSTPTDPILNVIQKIQHTPIQSDAAVKTKIRKPMVQTKIFSENPAKIENQVELREKNTKLLVIEGKCREAQKKKEDMLKSSSEETKRKREEYALRAAATREAVAAQEKIKLKEENKLKPVDKPKDEKVRLDKPKKRALPAMKQTENEKRKKDEEETVKLRKIKKPSPESELMEYELDDAMEGSESSDDSDRRKKAIPAWARKENRARPLLIQAYIDKKEVIRQWFFDQELKYPKVEELFPGKEVTKRPRASSAMWTTIVESSETSLHK